MASLESSLRLRDQFTNVLSKIDNSLKKTTQSMEDFKQKTTGPAQALSKLGSIAQASVSKLNSGLRTGLTASTNVVKSSIERILSIFGNFGNQISQKLNLQGFTSKIGAAFSGVKNKITAMSSAVGGAMATMKGKISAGFSGVVSAVSSGTKKIGGFLKQSGNAFKEYGNDVKNSLDKIKSSATSATSGFKSMVAAIGVTKAIGAGINVVKSSMDGAINRFDTLNQFPKMMQAIGFSFEDAAKSKDALVTGIDGLPTTLGDVVSTTQRIATLTRDLDGATKTTISLNNAFLASGSSSEDASRGLEQYVQMLSRGEVDMQSWRSLQETMGPALYDLATAFGFAGKTAQNDLYDALKEGTITFDQFNDKLIEFYNTGTDGAKRALIGSEGIKTSFKNIRTAVTNGVEGSIRKIDSLVEKISGKNIAQQFDGIKQKVKDVFTAINGNDQQAGWLDKLPGLVQKVTPYVDVLKNSFKDMKQPISDAFGAVKKSLAKLTGSFGSEKSVAGFKGFMDTITESVSKLAGFIEKHSDSIAKLISMLPKLALAFAGFKIGKGILSPLFGFSSAILGITKATGKLGGNLGKAFFGLFKKMTKKTPTSPFSDPKGKGNPLSPLTTFLDTMNSFAKGASGIALAFGVIKLIQHGAQALKEVNEKVPDDLSSMGKKFANMGIALSGMSILVNSLGKMASRNPRKAIAGLAFMTAISGELVLAAEAMKQISNKVPDDIGKFSSKMANMGIALSSLSVLTGIAGLIASKNPKAAISGLMFIAAISGELMLAAEAMDKINEKVPNNIDSFAPKMANMGIALSGMSVLVGIVGKLSSMNPTAAIAGLLVVATISGELMLAAEAMKQVNDKIPDDIGNFSSKVANMSIAIGAISGLIAVVGGLVATGIGGAVAIGGLATIAAVAFELMLVSEAIQQMNDKVPDDFSSVKTKIDSIAEVIGYFTNANLGNVMSVFSNLVGVINTGIVISGVNKMIALGEALNKLNEMPVPTGVEQKIEAVQSAIRALSGANLGEIISNFLGNVNFDLAKTSFEKLIQLAEKMNELNKINISGDAITEKINELKKVIGTLTDGDGIFGKFKEIVSGSLGNETFEKANETFSLLISIAQSANRLSSISVSVSDVKDKIKDINDVVQALDSGSLSGAIGSMVKTAQINQVKSALDALVSLINPINILGNTNMFPTTASRRIEEISDMIEKLGSGKITGVIGSMIKVAQLNEVKGALDAIVQLIAPINQLAQANIEPYTAATKVEGIGLVVEALGTSNLIEYFGTMLKGPQLGEVKNTLTALIELIGPLNQFASQEIKSAEATNKVTEIASVIEAIGNASLLDIAQGKINNAGIDSIRETISKMSEVRDAINSFASVAVNVEAVKSTVEQIKDVVTRLNEMPEITGVPGMQAMISTFNQLASELQSFIGVAQVSISGLMSVSTAFNASMQIIQTSVQIAMNAVRMAAVTGMAAFTAAILAGMASAAAAASSGVGQIVSAFNGLQSQLYSAGSFAMAGLTNGINAGAASAIAAAESVANRVASTVKKALDIHSPSRVAFALGDFFSQGLAGGILSAVSLVENASNTLATAAIPNQLANISASGNITSTVHLDDTEISRLQTSANQKVVVNNNQVVPQVAIHVENNGTDPIDTEALLEEFEDKIIELIDSDLN
ncbi:tape measure protein [Enterococcus faecalis]|nr:tape measure protein [Enterococcus faecalis]EGO2588444.1 tape measure protein [Enterococcus faecalis]EGO8198584.1 tape measure protein [Enterococcus faecalis]EGO8425473.1 phage tail tape measure protein [Enterococcus faecalis]EGS8053498.1 tape measure protein [Enterococcus faecalis]